MNLDNKDPIQTGEQELEQVLRNFRQSVHAWSAAEYSRPRSVLPLSAHSTWRRAAAWALGCVLAVGGLSAGLYQSHHKKELAAGVSVRQTGNSATAASQPTLASQPEAAVTEKSGSKQAGQAQSSSPDESLLASVDTDVSRQVPSAMEPLAQLMDTNENQ